MTGLLLTLFVIVCGVNEPDSLVPKESLRVVSACASLCILMKTFDWLRLFEATAFYVQLVQATIYDIAAFMILLIISLFIFGFPMGFLTLNSIGAENEVVTGVFGSWLPDLLFNQYLLALGEFNMDGFETSPQTFVCYLFFIGATFITQITMLNMLIAIMGDTFGRIIEAKEVNAMKTKIELMKDLSLVINEEKTEKEQKVFLFVVQPEINVEDEIEEWVGTFNSMKSHTEKKIKALEDKITTHFVKQEIEDKQSESRM